MKYVHYEVNRTSPQFEVNILSAQMRQFYAELYVLREYFINFYYHNYIIYIVN